MPLLDIVCPWSRASGSDTAPMRWEVWREAAPNTQTKKVKRNPLMGALDFVGVRSFIYNILLQCPLSSTNANVVCWCHVFCTNFRLRCKNRKTLLKDLILLPWLHHHNNRVTNKFVPKCTHRIREIWLKTLILTLWTCCDVSLWDYCKFFFTQLLSNC